MLSVEVVVEVEVGEEVVDAETAEADKTNLKLKLKIKIKLSLRVRNTKVPNIQTCRLVSGRGAGCISDTDEEHTSVLSLLHAPGRMSTLPSRSNETGTSPLTTN